MPGLISPMNSCDSRVGSMDSADIRLDNLIKEWNDTRLEIFHICWNQGEYVGVIRFFYQDISDPSNHISMKCIRLSSNARVRDLLPVLIEKFRPDLKNLSTDYCVCLVEEDGQQRILDSDEKPLLVQLAYMHKEGRFLLQTTIASEKQQRDAAVNLYKSLKSKEDRSFLSNRATSFAIKIYGADGYRIEKISPLDTLQSIVGSDMSVLEVIFKADGTCSERMLHMTDKPWHLIRKHSSTNGLIFFRSVSRHFRVGSLGCYLLQVDKHGEIIDQNQLIRLEKGRTSLGTATEIRLPANHGIQPVHCSILITNSESILIYPEATCFINGQATKQPFIAKNEVVTIGDFHFRMFFCPAESEKTSPPANYRLDVLPGLLEVPVDIEDDMLINTFSQTNLLQACPLAPTLCLYMAMRHRLSPYYYDQDGLQAALRILGKSLGLIRKMAFMQADSYFMSLALLGNCTELLNLLRRDRDLSGHVTTSERTLLSELSELCFNYLLVSLSQKCNAALKDSHIIALLDKISEELSPVLNEHITTQILSAIYFHINAQMVNCILTADKAPSPSAFASVVAQLEIWALRNKIGSDYLSQVKQVLDFLQEKTNALPDLLNKSQQIALLRLLGEKRGPMPPLSDIEESTEYRLPVIIPDSGYLIGADKETTNRFTIHGLSDTLLNFLEPLCLAGLCRLLTNERSLGRWIEFLRPVSAGCNRRMCCPNGGFNGSAHEHVRLYKRHGGLGLSIVAARGHYQPHQGIYVKAVLPGGSAEADGRLSPGDQLLSVNGICLLDMSQEQAAYALTAGCGSVVDLEVLKAAARNHGLPQLMSNDTDSSVLSNGSRHTSFRYAIDSRLRKHQAKPVEDISAAVDSLLTEQVNSSLSDDSLATDGQMVDEDRTSLESAQSNNKNQTQQEPVSNRSDNNGVLDTSGFYPFDEEDTSKCNDLAEDLAELSRQWSLVDSVSSACLDAKTVGTQEVYRDPRQRKLEEKPRILNVNCDGNGEGMSFEEKMKFFNSGGCTRTS